MTDLKLLPTWSLSLENAEMLLVLKALGGRLVKPEDVSAAKALGDTLTSRRAKQLRDQATMLEKALEET